MTDKHLTQSPAGEFVMFASDDGEVRVECRFEQETLWLPQATIANLYQVTPPGDYAAHQSDLRRSGT